MLTKGIPGNGPILQARLQLISRVDPYRYLMHVSDEGLDIWIDLDPDNLWL